MTARLLWKVWVLSPNPLAFLSSNSWLFIWGVVLCFWVNLEPRLPRRSAGHLLLSVPWVICSDGPSRTLWPCRSQAVMTAGGLFPPVSLNGLWCTIPHASSHSEGCWLVTVEKWLKSDISEVDDWRWVGGIRSGRQLPPGCAVTLP